MCIRGPVLGTSTYSRVGSSTRHIIVLFSTIGLARRCTVERRIDTSTGVQEKTQVTAAARRQRRRRQSLLPVLLVSHYCVVGNDIISFTMVRLTQQPLTQQRQTQRQRLPPPKLLQVRSFRTLLVGLVVLIIVIGIFGDDSTTTSFANPITTEEEAEAETSTEEKTCLATNVDPTTGTCKSSTVSTSSTYEEDEDAGEEGDDEYEYEYDYGYEDEEEDDNGTGEEEEGGGGELIHIAWGEPQIVEGLESHLTLQVLQATQEYMTKKVYIEDEYKYIRSECVNHNTKCSFWAAVGECKTDNEFMIEHCSPACQTCHQLEIDFFPNRQYETEDGEIVHLVDPGPMIDSDWGVAQFLGTDPDIANIIRQKVMDTHTYMFETVFLDETYEDVRELCMNKHHECTLWVLDGECETNPAFMNLQCAPACQTCEKISFEIRCPVNETEPMAWSQPGDLNRMFEHITTDPYYQEHYGPLEILSSPTTTGGPWIVTFDNFVSSDECQRLIDVGGEEGYYRSADNGELNEDGTIGVDENDGRTSTNAWCPYECHNDTLIGPVLERIEKITGVPDSHHEWLQLLRYEPGQFYGDHHDFNTLEVNRPQGPRILTLFMYLNDVESGGGTHFSRMNLTVMPKKGRAVIWPSVMDENPMALDERTHHEALPVEAGLKFGANAWAHQRDFKEPHAQGCA